MIKKTILLLIIISLIGCNSENFNFNVENGILIENATIITADEKEHIRTYVGYVLIESDSLLYSGEKKPIINGNYTKINAVNKFVIPGLIDSHVHVGHPIGIIDEDWDTNQTLINTYFKQVPKSFLYYGFTTLIDLDLSPRSKNRFESSPIKPRLFGTGRGIRYFNGYGPSFLPESIRYKSFPNWVYDKDQIDDIPKDIDLKKHTVEASIKNVLETAPVSVKTYFEPGFGGVFNWPVPSEKLLKEIVELTHQKNLPVVLHATSTNAYKIGLAAGVDVFAHSPWHWNSSKLTSDPIEEVRDILKQIAESGKYVQPTMRVITGEYEDYTWLPIDNPEITHVLPEVLIQRLRSEKGRFAQKSITELYNRHKPDSTISNDVYFKVGLDRMKNMVALYSKYGVKIILGSDTPASEGIGNIPGLNGFLEMKELFEAGVKLDEIFIATTYRNAKVFNIQNIVGSIEAGKSADLLILNSNPLENINAYNKIEYVIVEGKLLKRNELSARNLTTGNIENSK